MARREDQIRAAARDVFARERLGPLTLVGPLLVLAISAAWGALDEVSAETWPVGIILAGFLTGAMVRLLGRGTRPVFYVLSLLFYFATILFAVSLFGVMSSGFISTRLLIVVVGIGISAACGPLTLGISREEKWALRDNRGLLEPETPGGLLTHPLAAVLAVLSATLVIIFGGIRWRVDPATSGIEDLPWDVDPPIESWSAELAADPALAEDARKNGVGLGLDGSDQECQRAVEARHLDCDTNLCRAERSYVLLGCLETARAVRAGEPIRW